MRWLFSVFVLSVLLLSNTDAQAPTGAMNVVAERYARLVLALGQDYPDYVDAFYGPAEWKTQAARERNR